MINTMNFKIILNVQFVVKIYLLRIRFDLWYRVRIIQKYRENMEHNKVKDKLLITRLWMFIDAMIYNVEGFFVKNAMIMIYSFIIFKIILCNNKFKKMSGKIVKKMKI